MLVRTLGLGMFLILMALWGQTIRIPHEAATQTTSDTVTAPAWDVVIGDGYIRSRSTPSPRAELPREWRLVTVE
jgi:hypothetical protein